MVINISKSSSTMSIVTKNQTFDFILTEAGFYMLQESGSKIILDQSSLHPAIPVNVSKNSSTITKILKS